MTLDELQELLPERYRLQREIGRGGMAVVYLADDTVSGSEVAVKVMSGEFGAALDAVRFTREVQIAGDLRHPNILQASESGSGNGILWYTMPFVRGESVRARLDREGQLPIEDAVRIVSEVCDALAYAHEKGIVHRDIKPENILLEDGHAMVADFGIARLIAEGQGNTLTQTGLTLGTAQYMSPEQAAADKIDGRSDEYAVACVLYEMLVGEPPFTGPNAMAVLARAVSQPAPSVRIVRSAVPEYLDYAIRRALEKVPVDRFPTTRQFKAALRNEGDPKETRAWTTAYATSGGAPRPVPVWRQPRNLAIAGAIALALAGTAATYTVRRSRRLAAAAAVDSQARHVGVMYFDDGSPNGSLRFIADGLTESLIEELDRVPTLDVSSASAVRPFRGQPFFADSVHAALGVGTIVRGEVSPGARMPQVTVRLVDASSGAEIKNARFDLDTANALAARAALTQKVAEFLRQEVGLEVKLKESRLRTTSPQAWTRVQRAEKAIKDADSLIAARAPAAAISVLDSADAELVAATALDATWPQPLLTRARAALSRARALRDRPAQANTVLDSARAWAAAAIVLDPRSADAHEMAGAASFAHIELRTVPEGRDWDAQLTSAESDLREAVKLNPTQASAFERLAYLGYAKKSVPEALQAAMSAYTADAYLTNARGILDRLFNGNFDTENFPEARRWCDEGHRRFPRDRAFIQCSLLLMMSKGGSPDPVEAWHLADSMRATAKPATAAYTDHLARTLVGGVLGKAGLKDSANAVLLAARADRDADPAQEIIGWEIVMRLMYRDFDAAIARLGDYLQVHPDHRKGLANQTAWYWRDPAVQNDPRFQRLIAGAR